MELVSKSQSFLAKQIDKLDPETKSAFENKQLRFTDGDKYIRRNITGSSNIENLLETTDEKRVGRSNIDKNMLESKEHLAVQFVGLRHAKHATEANPSAISTYTAVGNDVPAALKNAEILIGQEGKNLLRLPVARFFSEEKSTRLNGVEDVVELNAIQVLKARLPINIQIEYADGQAVPTTEQHFIEVRLIGAQTIAK